ncbi:VWA domain-containing protein [Actinoplanes sp. GCM10030250]|uniref:VWA domain-containing protein n=1 Tax=Actinoplanes sp. GCM10030250 TaxID=3273376 RepID=UPI00360E1474
MSAFSALPAPVPLPVVASMVAGGETTVVVDLGAGPPGGTEAVTVTHDGVARSARLEPVVADGLAVTLVVDASSAGAATLPAWLSAAARFVLGAPSGTRSVVIPDRAPAAAITEPQRGASGVVRALDGVRAGGERDTAAALDLAADQFPEAADGRRVVVLYTTAADAGGSSAEQVAARYRASGTILVVVGTAAAAGYWSGAAAGTGGFFAPAGDPVVVPALDQVETTLSGRYLVRFPTPAELPARVGVRVETEELAFTGETVVEAPGGDAGRPWGPWIGGGVVLGLGLLVGLLLIVRGRAAPAPAPVIAPADGVEGDGFGAGPRSAHPMSPPAVGRASVPGRRPD